MFVSFSFFFRVSLSFLCEGEERECGGHSFCCFLYFLLVCLNKLFFVLFFLCYILIITIFCYFFLLKNITFTFIYTYFYSVLSFSCDAGDFNTTCYKTCNSHKWYLVIQKWKALIWFFFKWGYCCGRWIPQCNTNWISSIWKWYFIIFQSGIFIHGTISVPNGNHLHITTDSLDILEVLIILIHIWLLLFILILKGSIASENIVVNTQSFNSLGQSRSVSFPLFHLSRSHSCHFHFSPFAYPLAFLPTLPSPSLSPLRFRPLFISPSLSLSPLPSFLLLTRFTSLMQSILTT